jgi:hypothetical protein
MVTGILWSLVLGVPVSSVSARPAAIGLGPQVVLQVPYVAQSEELCGGAAIAMVERWWGRRGVYAEEFAPLVRPARGGILTTDLANATRSRGWLTDVARGTPELVQRALEDNVPVVALIQVGPDRYHYVVIVGWDARQVVFHDPAVRPFATLTTEAFLERWSGADRWALLVRPSPTRTDPGTPPSDIPAAAPVDSLPCRPWLDKAVDAAATDRLEDAERLLAAANGACPAEPLVLRELAGLRFRQKRHSEAGQLANEYLRGAPGDSLGWQLLASTRYLTGDESGALAAWNAIGRPLVDLVRIDGSRHVPFQVVAEAMAIAPGTVLTPDRLALARRRIADIPALASAHLSYAAVPGGFVEVRTATVERPVIGSLPRLLVAGALRGLVRHEAGLTLATPLGAGERWTLQWRWEAADPRRAVRLDIPAHLLLPGILSLEASWEQYRFAATSPSSSLPVEQRRATTLGYRGWLRPNVEALAGIRFERWAAEGDYLALSLGGALHEFDDRLLLIARGERATAFTGQASYARLQAGAAWASPTPSSEVTWSARLGTDWISGDAPRGLWPIAGGDPARAIPLRAHPRIVDHLLPTARTGRTIVHGGVAGDRHVATIGPVVLAAGLFLDGAEVIDAGGGSPRHQRFLDAGAGLRVGLAGTASTTLRVDLARGLLSEQRWGVTVGFQQRWPPRLQHFQ